MIITIDGPVATGKSTIARKLAEAIGFIYFDTGAMYRTLTYALIKNNINVESPTELSSFLKKFEFNVKVIKREKRYFVDHEDVTDKIRWNEITSAVSKISALKIVRDRLVEIQRHLAKGVNAVFEGRDMGSVVFPDATIKIFLTGKDEVRAQRRYDELMTKFPDQCKDLTFEQCLKEIMERDQYDSTRENSPLKQASDAFIIDTSNLTAEEIVYKILEYKDSLKTKQHPSHPPLNSSNPT